MDMNKISVVCHSGHGHTTNQAQGIISGIATVQHVDASLIAVGPDGEITEADWQAPDASDAIVFGSPTCTATGLMPANTKAARRDDINDLRSFGGLMAQSPSDAGTDEAPTTGDIGTAAAIGVRLAAVVRDLLR